ncbi:MAG: hypothetical protein ACLP1W_12985, partial [Rhodomicrobium sp.]
MAAKLERTHFLTGVPLSASLSKKIFPAITKPISRNQYVERIAFGKGLCILKRSGDCHRERLAKPGGIRRYGVDAARRSAETMTLRQSGLCLGKNVKTIWQELG